MEPESLSHHLENDYPSGPPNSSKCHVQEVHSYCAKALRWGLFTQLLALIALSNTESLFSWQGPRSSLSKDWMGYHHIQLCVFITITNWVGEKTELYCLTVLETGSSRWSMVRVNSFGTLWGKDLHQAFPRIVNVSPQSLIWYSQCIPTVSVTMSIYQDASHYLSRTLPTLVWPHPNLTNYFCNDPASK